jgi:3-methyladenine DNA glycosylase/8-oxoguanine DNA glycosylase
VRGRLDPTIRQGARGTWLTMRTADGPATVHLAARNGCVDAGAWGRGAAAALLSIPPLLGSGDDPSGFDASGLPDHLAASWVRWRDRWRVPRSGRVMEALVIAILEQKVTGLQARRAWSSLLRSVGSPAPGPAPEGMRVFPSATDIRTIPSWQWHRWGVQPQQSATILRAARADGRIEQCVDLDVDAARRRLRSIDGVGPWTVAEVSSRALGDPDAVSFGDFHLPGQVVYAFTGRRDGTDESMAALLEPFAGHRYRVQRLVELSGITRPARGPRMAISDHRHH